MFGHRYAVLMYSQERLFQFSFAADKQQQIETRENQIIHSHKQPNEVLLFATSFTTTPAVVD